MKSCVNRVSQSVSMVSEWCKHGISSVNMVLAVSARCKHGVSMVSVWCQHGRKFISIGMDSCMNSRLCATPVPTVCHR